MVREGGEREKRGRHNEERRREGVGGNDLLLFGGVRGDGEE